MGYFPPIFPPPPLTPPRRSTHNSVYIQSKMTLSQKVAKSGKEKGILFTFFFHTAFTSNNNLNMEMKMIDKAVKVRNNLRIYEFNLSPQEHKDEYREPSLTPPLPARTRKWPRS